MRNAPQSGLLRGACASRAPEGPGGDLPLQAYLCIHVRARNRRSVGVRRMSPQAADEHKHARLALATTSPTNDEDRARTQGQSFCHGRTHKFPHAIKCARAGSHARQTPARHAVMRAAASARRAVGMPSTAWRGSIHSQRCMRHLGATATAA